MGVFQSPRQILLQTQTLRRRRQRQQPQPVVRQPPPLGLLLRRQPPPRSRSSSSLPARETSLHDRHARAHAAPRRFRHGLHRMRQPRRRILFRLPRLRRHRDHRRHDDDDDDGHDVPPERALRAGIQLLHLHQRVRHAQSVHHAAEKDVGEELQVLLAMVGEAAGGVVVAQFGGPGGERGGGGFDFDFDGFLVASRFASRIARFGTIGQISHFQVGSGQEFVDSDDLLLLLRGESSTLPPRLEFLPSSRPRQDDAVVVAAAEDSVGEQRHGAFEEAAARASVVVRKRRTRRRFRHGFGTVVGGWLSSSFRKPRQSQSHQPQ
mmetsp:Transcript_18200/g.38038  ORF Transcript_18200/g.38038 Transcript_18200/m.38038 type:complete len:321 (+) Transcript_18200:148-1110(+)